MFEVHNHKTNPDEIPFHVLNNNIHRQDFLTNDFFRHFINICGLSISASQF